MLLLLAVVALAADARTEAFPSCAALGARLDRAAADATVDRIAALGLTVEPHTAAEGATPGHGGSPVQEAGVLEADRVVTDGRHVFALTSRGLAVADVAGRLVATVPLDGRPLGLFLHGGRVVALHAVDGWTTGGVRARVIAPSGGIERDLTVSGRPSAARLVGEELVLVTRSPVRRRPVVKGVAPSTLERDAAAWLPQVSGGDPLPCADVRVSTTRGALDAVAIHRLDLADGALSSRVVVAPSGTVYATAERVWLASTGRDTELHGVPVEGEVASGAVEGRLPDRFALSEAGGALRVATEADGARVTRLRIEGSALVEEGAVTGIAPDERLMSARFVGDTGYLVTFRVTDPLWVVDASELAVRGALTVPGWSDLLVPAGPGRLLAAGWDGGAVASLFDVSDPAAPRELARARLPSDSDARRDLSAWTLHEGVLALPAGDRIALFGPDLAPLAVLALPRAPLGAVFVGDRVWAATDAGLYGARIGADWDVAIAWGEPPGAF